MFCPECGTQNPDTAKFCVRCGFQTPMAGGMAGTPMPPQMPQMPAAAPASSGSKLPWAVGGVALIVIAGLVGFIVMRGANSSAQDENPTPRARNTANLTNTAPNAAAPGANSPAAVPPVSNTAVTASNTSTSQPATSPTATPASKAAKKPVDCDKKCYQVYDQCMADYRQNPDPESICRAKQQSCLIKCQ
jgi:hypothetical protein